MLTSLARLCRPCRLAGPAHPAATAGFSIPQGEIPRETDCLLEGSGFELPVPRCALIANSAALVAPPDSAVRGGSLRSDPLISASRVTLAGDLLWLGTISFIVAIVTGMIG